VRGITAWVIDHERDPSVRAGDAGSAGHGDCRVLDGVACVEDAKGRMSAAVGDECEAGIGLGVLESDCAAVMLDACDEVNLVSLRVEVKARDRPVPRPVERDRGAKRRGAAVGAADDDLPALPNPTNPNARLRAR
jgi:hypothetical protein